MPLLESSLHAGVKAACAAEICLQHAMKAGLLGEPSAGSVGAVVVEDDDLGQRLRLMPQRAHAFLEHGQAVSRRRRAFTNLESAKGQAQINIQFLASDERISVSKGTGIKSPSFEATPVL